MTSVLSLDDARAALRLPPNDDSPDSDLETVYIPAVDTIIESLSGPQVPVVGRTLTVNGGMASILLPCAVTAVTEVTENGAVLVQDRDYRVNATSGIVTRGNAQFVWVFWPGVLNVSITYNAGPTSPPANVTLAARIILAALYRPEQGVHPDFGGADDDTVMTPAGYAIPRRAVELLRPTPAMPGFA